MTSIKKLRVLRLLIEDALLRRDAPPVVGKLLAAWSLIPGRMKRGLVGDLLEGFDMHDPAFVDELLGLVAGLALELRSDHVDIDVDALQEQARELLGRVLPQAA